MWCQELFWEGRDSAQSGLAASLGGRWARTLLYFKGFQTAGYPKRTLMFAFWAQIPPGFLVGPVT